MWGSSKRTETRKMTQKFWLLLLRVPRWMS